MKIVVTFMLMCSFISGTVRASEMYPIKKVDSIYTVNSVPVSTAEIERMLRDAKNSEVIRILDSGESKKDGGRALIVLGIGSILGFGAAAWFGGDGEDSNRLTYIGLSCAGAVVSIAGTAVYKSGSEQRDKAINIYNNQIANKELSLSVSQDRFCFEVRF